MFFLDVSILDFKFVTVAISRIIVVILFFEPQNATLQLLMHISLLLLSFSFKVRQKPFYHVNVNITKCWRKILIRLGGGGGATICFIIPKYPLLLVISSEGSIGSKFTRCFLLLHQKAQLVQILPVASCYFTRRFNWFKIPPPSFPFNDFSQHN